MKDFLRQFNGRDHGPLVQFIKYGIAGAAATVVHILLFYVMASTLFPALAPGDVLARYLHLPVVSVSDALRARNSIIDNIVAFMFSNLTAYFINIWWVFERGRHHFLVEIGAFYAVSGISVVVGSTIMGFLIHHYGMTTTAAFSANVLCSLMINFVMRKYFVFKG